MASGYEVNGVDLDSYFNLIQSWETPISTNTGLDLNGVDLRLRYSPLADGTQANATGYEVNGADLNTLFAKIGTVGSLTETLSPTGVSGITGNQEITFTANASKGVTPYKYSWSVSNSQGSIISQSGDSATVKFYAIPDQATSTVVSCAATDSESPSKEVSASANCYIVAGLYAYITPHSGNVVTGTTVTFSANVSNGASPYTYKWSLVPTSYASYTIVSQSGGSITVTLYGAGASVKVICDVSDSTTPAQTTTASVDMTLTNA